MTDKRDPMLIYTNFSYDDTSWIKDIFMNRGIPMNRSIDYTIHPGKKATDAIVYKGDTPVNFHTTADTYTENAKALQHFMKAFATTNTVTIYVEQKDQS